jgi:branched-chain amino acid transport system permease protein
VIDILIIAVIGGLRRPIGPFVGAFIYVLLGTFSPDVLSAFGLSNERFKLLIGLGFLAGGVLLARWRARPVGPLARERRRGRPIP